MVDGNDHSSMWVTTAKGEAVLFKVTASEGQTDTMFILSQLAEWYSKMFDNYRVSYGRILVARVRADDEEHKDKYPYEWIGGKGPIPQSHITVTANGESPAGEFLVYTEVDWADEEQYNTFVFRTYS